MGMKDINGYIQVRGSIRNGKRGGGTEMFSSSYGVEIKHNNKIFHDTIKIYRAAVKYVINIVEKNWYKIDGLDKFTQFSFVESWIHSTKSNQAICNFDAKFPKIPKSFRSAVISEALRHLKAYHTSVSNWEIDGYKGRKPTLNANIHCMPIFYNKYMFEYPKVCNGAKVYIKLKLYTKNDWRWVPIELKKTDWNYIRKQCLQENSPYTEISCPKLEYRNKKYFLRFNLEGKLKLPQEKPLESRKILSVDLGINTDAVCSVMDMSCTIQDRRFINFKREKDLINHKLNILKKKLQPKYNNHNLGRIWRYINKDNKELAYKTARHIIDYAVSKEVSVIVLENLDFKGKIRGGKAQRIALWKKRYIVETIKRRAHLNGIRVSLVNPANTSELAYDGSGEVTRNSKNRSLCTFTSGKQYNTDLSASYNIGARYFIREILKNERVKESLVAIIPEAEHLTQCTFNTLEKINKSLSKTISLRCTSLGISS